MFIDDSARVHALGAFAEACEIWEGCPELSAAERQKVMLGKLSLARRDFAFNYDPQDAAEAWSGAVASLPELIKAAEAGGSIEPADGSLSQRAAVELIARRR